MPLGPRRSSRPIRRFNPRQRVWSTFDNNSTVASGLAGDVDLLAPLEVAGASVLGCTVLRTLIKVYVPWSGVAGDGIYAGTMVGNLSDVGTGRLDPGPAAAEDDWAFLTRVFQPFTGAAADANREYFWDIKSKRRIEELNSRWVFAWHNLAAGNKTISIYVRTLVALA